MIAPDEGLATLSLGVDAALEDFFVAARQLNLAVGLQPTVAYSNFDSSVQVRSIATSFNSWGKGVNHKGFSQNLKMFPFQIASAKAVRKGIIFIFG